MKKIFLLLISFIVFCSSAQELRLVKDINNQSSEIENIFSTNYFLLVSATDSIYENELWRTDGTDSGTYMVKDIEPNGSSFPLLPVVKKGNKAIFYTQNSGLWITNGSSDSTFRITKDHPVYAVDNKNMPVVLSDKIIFVASKYNNLGRELYIAGGDSNGSVILKDIKVGSESSNPEYLTVFKNHVYFIADDNIHGREIWRTDGTSGNTELFYDFEPDPKNSFMEPIGSNSEFIFFIERNESGKALALWRNFGESFGFVKIKDFDFLDEHELSNIKSFVYKDDFYFSGLVHFFKTDGFDVREISSDEVYSYNFINDKIFFISKTGSHKALNYLNKNGGPIRISTFQDIYLAFFVYNNKILLSVKDEDRFKILELDPELNVLSEIYSSESYFEALGVVNNKILVKYNEFQIGTELHELVLEKSPYFIHQPEITSSCFGDSILLIVDLFYDTIWSEVDLQWQKNGKDILYATTDTLYLNNISASDNGTYKCVLKTSKYKVVSNPVTLNVVSRPKAKFNRTYLQNGFVSFLPVEPKGLDFTWNFGDGKSSGLYSPTHNYFVNGIYNVTLKVANGNCKSSYTDTVNINSASVQEIDNPTVMISPNPFNDFITVETDQQVGHIEIFDANGKRLLNKDNVSSSYFKFDLSRYQSGVYFIHVWDVNNSVVKKIVKQ
jgi:ELWxxDGT repeat protein